MRQTTIRESEIGSFLIHVLQVAREKGYSAKSRAEKNYADSGEAFCFYGEEASGSLSAFTQSATRSAAGERMKGTNCSEFSVKIPEIGWTAFLGKRLTEAEAKSVKQSLFSVHPLHSAATHNAETT